MARKKILLISIFLLLVFIVACVPILSESNQVDPTQLAFNNAVNETITARAILLGNSGHELATSFANATQLSQTITAQAEINGSSYPATATAAFPVLQELRHYGISPFDGQVAWLHKPVTINLVGPNQFGYANDYPQITAKDFVFASDITWNTNYGLSGCGYMFRSDGNSSAPTQFMVLMTRFAEGQIAFSALAGGNIINLQNSYPWTKDKSFSWQNNATNRLVIVARANLIDIYTNGVMISEVDTTKPPPASLNMPTFPQLPVNPTAQELQSYQQMLSQYNVDVSKLQTQLALVLQNYYSNKIPTLSDGFLGFAASSSSGTAECQFSNSWLFLFNQPPTLTPTITPTFNGTPYTSTPTPTLTRTATRSIFIQPTPTNTFVHVKPPTATAAPPSDTPIPPTATQPPVPTATQPPVPTATQPPVTP